MARNERDQIGVAIAGMSYHDLTESFIAACRCGSKGSKSILRFHLSVVSVCWFICHRVVTSRQDHSREPHGEGGDTAGRDGPEKFAHGQGVTDATGVTGYLPESDRAGGASQVSRLVSLGALGGTEAAKEGAALDGQGGRDDREKLAGNFGALEMGYDRCVRGRTQQRVQRN